MHTYHLQDEFRDPAAERQLLAAIAQQPTLYFELLDSLPTDVFTDTQEVHIPPNLVVTPWSLPQSA